MAAERHRRGLGAQVLSPRRLRRRRRAGRGEAEMPRPDHRSYDLSTVLTTAGMDWRYIQSA